MSTPFEGFSKLSFIDRLKKLKTLTRLSDEELSILSGQSEGLTLEKAEHLIENVIGTFSLPLGIGTHFKIDGKDIPIPMAIEETSVVAAASAAAKWIHRNGGFTTKALGNLIIGQVQFPFVHHPHLFKEKIENQRQELVDAANEIIPNIAARGGGVTDIQVRIIPRPDGETMAVLHVLCNPCDAMGANLINRVCEGIKPLLEEITQENAGLCILSNLVDTKLVEAKCEISDIEPELGQAIEEATLFANLDPYRGSTHNKGVMNGIDPVVIATGNDWRAVEAGVHAYVSLNGKYRSITSWTYKNNKLYGHFKAPLALGTVGGVTKLHPTAKVCLKMMGVERAEDLARICAAVGLAQNFAALRALCSEGIVQGHMRLHATNLAIAAGASQEEIKIVQEKLKQDGNFTLSRAEAFLQELRAATKQAPEPIS